MKKLSILSFALAAVLLTACGGKKSAEAAADADTLKSYDQQMIEASIKAYIDSIADEIGRLKQPAFVQDNHGGLTLTKAEKLVKPTYLLQPALADSAATLAEKYRVLGALGIDKRIANLYEMPVDDYSKAIAKLLADISDPSFKAVANGSTLLETTSTLYDAMDENGRINFFWQMAAATLVEELYLITQNSDKLLSVVDDEAASNLTFRLVLITDAMNRLSQYDPDVKPIVKAIAPLETLNATTVGELKAQLREAEDKIKAARETIIN